MISFACEMFSAPVGYHGLKHRVDFGFRNADCGFKSKESEARIKHQEANISFLLATGFSVSFS
jgi:hypothetical protein